MVGYLSLVGQETIFSLDLFSSETRHAAGGRELDPAGPLGTLCASFLFSRWPATTTTRAKREESDEDVNKRVGEWRLVAALVLIDQRGGLLGAERLEQNSCKIDDDE